MKIGLEHLARIREILNAQTFEPQRFFRGKHLQTLIGYLSARRFRLQRAHRADAVRLFEIETGVRLLARCRWQNGNGGAHPTLVLVHGLEGSSESVYMLGTAAKAFAAGFNVIRLNLRTCGDTAHLTQTTYHAGLSGDVQAVLRELIERDRLTNIFVAGFSLGGNICLKLAGELGESAFAELRGVAAISPSIDLSRCADAIEKSENRLYQKTFVNSLKKRLRSIEKLYPEIYNLENLRETRTIREFDQRFTSVYGGFKNVDDYYRRSSALPLIEKIRVPALVVHAQDDPFVPFESFENRALNDNPWIILLAPARGGHVGFIGCAAADEDRFWAENRIIEFCRSILKHNKTNVESDNKLHSFSKQINAFD